MVVVAQPSAAGKVRVAQRVAAGCENRCSLSIHRAAERIFGCCQCGPMQSETVDAGSLATFRSESQASSLPTAAYRGKG